MESTATTSTRYLYGRDCLGEVRDGTLLYYLADGQGYVRQSTDEDGAVMDAWLFTPDGGVMAGPQGPVSHLVCGGVYDWSTGLLYNGGRYFDPTLGIWLALGPLAVIQGWRERKRKRKVRWVVLVLMLGIGVSGLLVACKPSCPEPEHTYCLEEFYPRPAPLPVSSEEVEIRPTHGVKVTEFGGFHWPCRFFLSCAPQKEGMIIQEIDFRPSDGPPEHFWEAWPVEAGAFTPPSEWTNEDCRAGQGIWPRPGSPPHAGCGGLFNDFFTVLDPLPLWSQEPGHRKVEGFVKFYYVSPWPPPGWEKMGSYRTYNPPPFWDRRGSTRHEILINWDGTSSWGHTAHKRSCEFFHYP